MTTHAMNEASVICFGECHLSPASVIFFLIHKCI